MSERFLQLASATLEDVEVKAAPGDEVIEVSLPASSAATIYEKARLAIDNQEEHLLRRNAIYRIIKRYAGTESTINEIADRLLRELIWARYLPNKTIPVSIVNDVAAIIQKYEPLIQAIELNDLPEEDAFGWILDVMSTEIEYRIAPPLADEALVSYMFDEMKERVEWDDKYQITPEQKELSLYIAIHRALLKSDKGMLRFRVFTLYYPDWPGPAKDDLVKKITSDLAEAQVIVDKQIDHAIVHKLEVLIKRKCTVFHVLSDIAKENGENVVDLLGKPESLDKEVRKALKVRTKNFRKRLRRTVVRAIMFLFLTKMLAAIVLEVPYEFWYLKHDAILPLITNIFFPPVLLALLALTVTIPEKRNATDHVEAVRALMVGADHPLLNVRVKLRKSSTWDVVFNLLYVLVYLIVYGGLTLILIQLHFIWLGIVLFLFFLSLVAFFGIRIRLSTKDIVLSESRRGFLGILFDYFMVPVVRLGRWLSVKVSQVNVFVYFFDFILEAPYKLIVRIIDNWTDFITEKREEL